MKIEALNARHGVAQYHKEAIVNKRTLLATATLTALVLTVGTLHPTPVGGAAELASATQPAAALDMLQTVEAPAAPQWGRAFGLGIAFSIASTVVCSAFMGPGGIACGITGAL